MCQRILLKRCISWLFCVLLALVEHRECAAVCSCSVRRTVAAVHGRSPLNNLIYLYDIEIHYNLICLSNLIQVIEISQVGSPLGPWALSALPSALSAPRSAPLSVPLIAPPASALPSAPRLSAPRLSAPRTKISSGVQHLTVWLTRS